MEFKCPKCHWPTSSKACPKCGLIFAKFDKRVLEEGIPDSLKNLWTTVINNWSDPAVHALFLEQVLFLKKSGYGAYCYRQFSEDEIAKKQLERINQRLEVSLLEMATEPETQRKNKVWLHFFLIFIVLAFILLALILWLK